MHHKYDGVATIIVVLVSAKEEEKWDDKMEIIPVYILRNFSI